MTGRNANGEGSIWQRKDGRWCAAAYLRSTEGGRRRVTVYGKSRQDAKVKLRDLLDKVDHNVPATPVTLTVAQYLTEWLAHIRQHVRPSTYTAYASNIRLHLTPRIGKRKLPRLTVRDVRVMVDQMRADGLNPRSIQYAHATLRSALEHACREEIIPRNVARLVRIEAPTPLKPREPLTGAEARKLLAALRGEPHEALWSVLLMLGLRRSEACALLWDDIDFAARTLRINKSIHRTGGELRVMPTKTRRSNRTIPLPPRCLYALSEHHRRLQEQHGSGPGHPGHPTGYMFGTRTGTLLEPRNLTRMWTNLCREHGIRNVPLHGLRHSCVSLLQMSGVASDATFDGSGDRGVAWACGFGLAPTRGAMSVATRGLTWG